MNDLFPQKEYRGFTATDTNVRSIAPASKSQTIDTQFDAATANTLAAAILAATKNPGRSYTFTVDGIVSPSAMKSAMGLVNLTYGTTISNYVMKITALKVNLAKQQTTITARGVS
jgi:hypothetical protein